MTDFSFSTVEELGTLLRKRQTTVVDLTKYFLERLERLGPRFNAVVTVLRRSALDEAAERDRELASGTDRGPLHGIPYGVKDLLAAEGAPTTWGAEPYRHQMLQGDATVVTRLREAGAVLCAKLGMVELAGGMGYNQAFASFTGPGKSPWDPSRWSGGSSSGPGSAV
ncbi:MAG: amidase family protein, partial [Gemmatimonadales bacterium]